MTAMVLYCLIVCIVMVVVMISYIIWEVDSILTNAEDVLEEVNAWEN